MRLLCSFAAVVALISALAAMPQPTSTLPARAAGDPHEGKWSREQGKDGWQVAIQFTNYNGDRLTTSFPVTRLDIEQATQEFGYTKKDTDAIFDACKATCDQAEYDRRIVDYYRGRGLLVVESDNIMNLWPDMPALVLRNSPRVRATAIEVQRIAQERRYDSGSIIGAVLSLAQTGITYFSPPMEEDGKRILGLYVPPQVLGNGKGDCDSKTGLIASVLKNFSGARMIGINVPDHYLMGIARVPQRGDAYIQYDGEPYVLLEAAGPAWMPPGTISDYSRDKLGTMRDVRIDPFK